MLTGMVVGTLVVTLIICSEAAAKRRFERRVREELVLIEGETESGR